MNLEEAIQQFNLFNGRLRISITPSCNLSCVFCHTEGNHDHSAKKFMHPKIFSKLRYAFEKLGGKEINITGGEPLLHPKICEILDSLKEKSFYASLSTNGLALKRILERPKYNIDVIKISFHTVKTDEQAKSFLGKAWNYELLKQNIQLCRKKGYNIILNYILTSTNVDELPQIIRESIDLDCNLKIIDLETMEHSPEHNKSRTTDYFNKNFVPPEKIESVIQQYASYKGLILGQTGSAHKKYTTKSGTSIMLKDPNKGRFSTEICKSCDKDNICSEGVFALRVNTNGTYKPCILRNDLDMQSPTSYEIAESEVELILSKAIYQLMTGEFTKK